MTYENTRSILETSKRRAEKNIEFADDRIAELEDELIETRRIRDLNERTVSEIDGILPLLVEERSPR